MSGEVAADIGSRHRLEGAGAALHAPIDNQIRLTTFPHRGFWDPGDLVVLWMIIAIDWTGRTRDACCWELALSTRDDICPVRKCADRCAWCS